MPKQVFTAEQIREEVGRRLLQEVPKPEDRSEISVPLPTAHRSEISVPLPTAHLLDADERNWDMKYEDHDQRDKFVRRVIEEARRDFLLSDSAERDEILGDSFAHS